jgi:hypothetical protein
MMCGETVAVYCENHVENTDALRGENAGFGTLEQVVWVVTTGP